MYAAVRAAAVASAIFYNYCRRYLPKVTRYRLDQTYTEYDSVISYEAPLASEDLAAVDSAEGSADQSSSGEYSELKSSSTLQMGAPGSAPVAGAGAPTAGELRAEQASQLMQLGYELEETLQRSPVTSGQNPEGSDPAVAQSGPM